MIYLDHNATTPVHPEVRRTIGEFLDAGFGNPSSAHAAGRHAKRAVDDARAAVAAAIGAAHADAIVFTASATESDNMAVLGGCLAAPAERRRLVISAVDEHRLPNTLHVSLPGVSARTLVARLADEVALSPGAACHADAPAAPSGVMQAIGATPEQAHGALRLSLGYATSAQDIERAAGRIVAAWRQAAR